MAIPPWENLRAPIAGEELEKLVIGLLAEAGASLEQFRVEHQERFVATDGTYRIDVTVRFRVLEVDFLVLVECKDHVRPVEREDVQVLADKMRALGAQKAILFATNGFQKGALEYAHAHRIALVRIIEGRLTYETKGIHPTGQRSEPPPWANIQAFVGHCMRADEGKIHVSQVERGRPDALKRYLESA